MAQPFRFQCSRCEAWHEGAPSVAFELPDFLQDIPEAERAGRAQWTEDLCAVDDQFFFARACLEVPIVGNDEPFLWGIWVSLSRSSFEDYVDRFDRGEAGGPYFSWLANRLPGYPLPVGLKSQTTAHDGDNRPLVTLERTDHPLSVDFHQGMPFDRAVAVFEQVIHRVERPS